MTKITPAALGADTGPRRECSSWGPCSPRAELQPGPTCYRLRPHVNQKLPATCLPGVPNQEGGREHTKAHPSEHTLDESGNRQARRELQVTGKQALQRPEAVSQFRTLSNKASRPDKARGGSHRQVPQAALWAPTGTLSQPVSNEALETAVQSMWRKQPQKLVANRCQKSPKSRSRAGQ